MKAQEYYEQYKDGFLNKDEAIYLDAANKFLVELFKEADELRKIRHVKYDRGFLPILREQNEKYRAVVRLFVKKHGASPIKPEGFEEILAERFPGMNVVEKMKGRAPRPEMDTHTREDAPNA